MPKTVILRIKRQEAPKGAARWDEFELPHEERLNVIRCLQMIQRNPVTRQGKEVPAPVWDQSCLEEVCGACTMIVNGKVRQACTALVDELTQPITLEPLTKFPLVKDLVVDRQRFFADLKNAKAWVDVDGTHALGAGPKYSEAVQEIRYELSRCMTCGCCLEVCPQYGEKKAFVGAAVISQVRVFNLHPTGAMQADKRLEVLTKPGGIADCGNAQNCARACPKLIPLTESISAVGGQMAGYGLRKFLRKN
jgi:succinate dehydrogenase / fumarate reductase iron-sulfur subunit